MEESGLRNAGLYGRPLKQSTVLEFKYLLLLRTNASLRLVASDDVLCPLTPLLQTSSCNLNDEQESSKRISEESSF